MSVIGCLCGHLKSSVVPGHETYIAMKLYNNAPTVVHHTEGAWQYGMHIRHVVCVIYYNKNKTYHFKVVNNINKTMDMNKHSPFHICL